MKINSSRPTLRRPSPVYSSADLSVFRQSAEGRPGKVEQGVALVITLIMLSVTLVMAVAFLAISQRGKQASSTAADTTQARLAQDSALSYAQAQIIANIVANTNWSGTGLLVSTNYINTYGFDPNFNPRFNPPWADPLNVNYDVTVSGQPLTADQRAENIANLQILPRAPVFMSTNEPDGRFYLDLNRNGKFEGNGWQPQYGRFGGYLHPDGTEDNVNRNVVTNLVVGDPEWVGVLERPDLPHGPQNKFIGRYAFIAQPVSDSLDFNAIHNQALGAINQALDATQDSFVRNQGIGSWELNLASFLADLNTNTWDSGLFTLYGPYAYNRINTPNPINFGPANTGQAFRDAWSVINYRYGTRYGLLAPSPTNIWYNGVDEYDVGPLQTTATNTMSAYLQPTGLPWLGSDNTNRFFILDDLLDATKAASFATNLVNTGLRNSSYDRYTYYRMLDQIGIDSAPESSQRMAAAPQYVKMNLNYDNVDIFRDARGNLHPPSSTNFMTWTDVGFFTNAADRLLRSYTTSWYQRDPTNYLITYFATLPRTRIDPNGAGLTNIPYFGITNQIPSFGVSDIPVIHNGTVVYSAAVNRLLQLAANMYDGINTNHYPSVFKPVFWRQSPTNAVIAGYVSMTDYKVALTGRFGGWGDLAFKTAYFFSDLLTNSAFNYSILDNTNFNAQLGPNIYGIPWIIGAKKGFPNFNEFSFDDILQFTRRLQFFKNNVNDNYPSRTNEMVTMSFTNKFGIEYWNPYGTNFTFDPATTYIFASDAISQSLWLSNSTVPLVFQTNLYLGQFPKLSTIFSNSRWPSNYWDASTGRPVNNQAFMIPLSVTTSYLPEMAYNFANADLVDYVTDLPDAFNQNLGNQQPPPVPAIFLRTTNHVRSLFIADGHIVDYVQFDGPIYVTNVTRVFQGNFPNYAGGLESEVSNMWSTFTASSGGTPQGIANQTEYSETANQWSQSGDNSIQVAVEAFWKYMGGQHFSEPEPFHDLASGLDVASLLSSNGMQAPYTPSVTVRDYTSWQANDPFVHYLVSDLALYGNNFSQGINPGMTVENASAKVRSTNSDLPNLGKLNQRYAPWGQASGVPAAVPIQITTENPSGTRNAYDTALQDPLLWSADFWNFPTNKLPGIGWLGRIHRGTPWQTVYLKSRDIYANTAKAPNGIMTQGQAVWEYWTEDFNTVDALNMAPVQDRLLFDSFTTSPNDNATRGQLSVNQTHRAAWSALFSGLVALRNTNQLTRYFETSAYGWTNIAPAGVDAANSVLSNLVEGTYGINQTRTNRALNYGGSFHHEGDILQTPALTDRSPLFNTNLFTHGAGVNLTNGISDAAYEWLPEQVMSMLKLDSAPRYAIYCYGQALKPAVGGQVTSGQNFGLVTNYQVVAESAARAVVEVHPHVFYHDGISSTNYTTTIESYNALPPN